MAIHRPGCGTRLGGPCNCGDIEQFQAGLTKLADTLKEQGDALLLGLSIVGVMKVEGVLHVLVTPAEVKVLYKGVWLSAQPDKEKGEGMGAVAGSIHKILKQESPWPDAWGTSPFLRPQAPKVKRRAKETVYEPPVGEVVCMACVAKRGPDDIHTCGQGEDPYPPPKSA